MNKPIITRIASIIQPHLSNEEINSCLEGKDQIEWVMGSVSDRKELWNCPINRVRVLAGPLSQKELNNYFQIKKQHYVIYNKKQVNRNLQASASGIYFFWCCANCEPYIAITPYKKYCNVSIDLITLEDSRRTTLSEEGRKSVGDLFSRETVRRGGACWCSSPLGTFSYSNSILKVKAEEVAAELYNIWQQYKIVNNGGVPNY